MYSCDSDGRTVQTECKTGDTLDFNGMVMVINKFLKLQLIVILLFWYEQKAKKKEKKNFSFRPSKTKKMKILRNFPRTFRNEWKGKNMKIRKFLKIVSRKNVKKMKISKKIL